MNLAVANFIGVTVQLCSIDSADLEAMFLNALGNIYSQSINNLLETSIRVFTKYISVCNFWRLSVKNYYRIYSVYISYIYHFYDHTIITTLFMTNHKSYYDHTIITTLFTTNKKSYYDHTIIFTSTMTSKRSGFPFNCSCCGKHIKTHTLTTITGRKWAEWKVEESCLQWIHQIIFKRNKE